jgi:dihydrolipoamide dehydrogenase
MNYDLLVIGSGPGGYVAAIRASQLGLKVAVVEKEDVGGVCLNWGCIPTKSLLKSAKVFSYLKKADSYGIKVEGSVKADFQGMISRSRTVADGMSKGVQYLFKKNKIEHIKGLGKLSGKNRVSVTDSGGETTDYTSDHIIVATGARSKELPSIKQDGKKIIGYRQALSLDKQPESILVIGSGAIGSEFACFYASIGTKVTIVEFMPTLVPNEDEEISKQLARSFKKMGVEVMVGSSVESVNTLGNKTKVTVKTKKGIEVKEVDIVIQAVGIVPNIEDIGLDEIGVTLENGMVAVDDYYRTNIEGVYAIGDIIKGPALAHVASAEGIVCVESIANKNPEPIDYNNIPACTYTSPEIASVGLTEKKAREEGYDIKVGKFPFTASGKASALGEKDGFVKLVFDSKYGELLGAHLIGENVTEIIAELVVARKLEITGSELIKSIHPHPTISEAVMEAAAAAFDEVIHL